MRLNVEAGSLGSCNNKPGVAKGEKRGVEIGNSKKVFEDAG